MYEIIEGKDEKD